MKSLLIQACLVIFCFSGCAQNNQKTINLKTPKVENLQLSEEEWKAKLTPQQYYILREKGTERAFSGQFVFTKEKGLYKCAGCGTSLFSDEMKFESHCGWPSFDKEISGGKIIQSIDNSFGMKRIEITCAKCGGHLGHLFDDGPTETGMRYCVNSGALLFEPQVYAQDNNMMDTITLGGGCFWCIEAIFEDLKGVSKVVSGYSGGKTENPTYRQVCSGTTNHAEVVQITFDKSVISLTELLEVFFTLHDPTTLNRQGADIGTQYRSVIFYHNEDQKKIAHKVITTLNNNGAFANPIVTEISSIQQFYPAEDYHQQYYELNMQQPYCKAVIKPKLDKLHQIFSDKLK